jgi:hypothetical protein
VLQNLAFRQVRAPGSVRQSKRAARAWALLLEVRAATSDNAAAASAVDDLLRAVWILSAGPLAEARRRRKRVNIGGRHVCVTDEQIFVALRDHSTIAAASKWLGVDRVTVRRRAERLRQNPRYVAVETFRSMRRSVACRQRSSSTERKGAE